MVFANDDSVMVMYTPFEMKIFLLNVPGKEAISLRNLSPAIRIEDNERILPPSYKPFRLLNATYSNIAQVYVDNVRPDDDSIDGWIVLQSSKFTSLHFLQLSDLIE